MISNFREEVLALITGIGERIKKRRKELNLTHTQIKEETGISSGNMSSIESGKTIPSASALIKLSKTLNCSIDWMVTGESPISENFKISDIEERLLTGFRKLPEEDQNELIEILQIKLNKTNRSEKVDQRLSESTNTENKRMA